MDNITLIILLAFPILFTGLWIGVILLLRKKSGMQKEIIAERGLRLSESGWGSAIINGVNANHCARVAQYEFGYQIEMMWIFGSGKLWLPANEMTIEKETGRRLLFPASKVIRYGNNKIKLYGRLSQAITR